MSFYIRIKLILILNIIFFTYSIAQSYDSLASNPELLCKLCTRVDTSFNGHQFKYLYQGFDSENVVTAFGNISRKGLAKGSWIFLWNDKIVLTGKYRNGLQHGYWRYPSGNYIRYRNGKQFKVRLVGG